MSWEWNATVFVVREAQLVSKQKAQEEYASYTQQKEEEDPAYEGKWLT